MKTVKDYMEIAKQFTFVSDGMKIHELIMKHGVDLSMLKFVQIRRLQKAMADFCCGDCVFSHEAKVWTMCDKHHRHATRLCDDFQSNTEAQEYVEKMKKRIAEIRDIKDYDEFLEWLKTNDYGYRFYEAKHCTDFYDCCINESIAREALLSLSKYELKEIEQDIGNGLDRIGKLQQLVADTQNHIQERREQLNRTNDFIASLI